MSVLKNLRSLSSMKFYKNAIELRKAITMWMLRDFGTRRNTRSVASVVKDIDKVDKRTIDEIHLSSNRFRHFAQNACKNTLISR